MKGQVAKQTTHFLRKSRHYFMIKWIAWREKALDTLGSSPDPYLLAGWLWTSYLLNLSEP